MQHFSSQEGFARRTTEFQVVRAVKNNWTSHLVEIPCAASCASARSRGARLASAPERETRTSL